MNVNDIAILSHNCTYGIVSARQKSASTLNCGKCVERHGGSKIEGPAFASAVDKDNCLHRLHLPWLDKFTNNMLSLCLNMVMSHKRVRTQEPSGMNCRMEALE